MAKNPKEDAYVKIVYQQYDKAKALQAEKVAFSEKAAALLDRHIKRFDVKVRDLQNDGSIPHDPQLPSLLRPSPGNLVAPSTSTTNTGANTPLHPLSVNVPAGNIANAAVARMVAQVHLAGGPGGTGAAASVRHASPAGAAGPLHGSHPLAHSMSAGAAQRTREMSVGSDTKRRRLNSAVPTAGSSLRQSSLGPGTPKGSAPASRAGSVPASGLKKGTPAQTKKPGTSSQLATMRKRLVKGQQKKAQMRRLGLKGASPSTTGVSEDESGTEASEGSDDTALHVGQHDGAADEMDEGEEEDGDDTKYCFCQSVSYGDMVACDNANCKYQWFHWGCIGIDKEPVGDWLCPECSKLPPSRIKKA
ncbi:hypothetical protein P152DRAFT_454464 [Eremomyces bilateralis CBS 781.70]|uniref:Chromatin modification-related protein n=1 Tax=Eremomyces bilateralis CBS 781.70 TaxID=1392243 RepID=A0A6G1GEB0_9PEZI|nr:uncharacterized protein P152DRAFT_454464 [Eremomyces bilateralis CBS 781.70]KAF1816209.1 hypothetical protein P152DRAFT_454464 [Eremomyces bilateralis CBS 781.70]